MPFEVGSEGCDWLLVSLWLAFQVFPADSVVGVALGPEVGVAVGEAVPVSAVTGDGTLT